MSAWRKGDQTPNPGVGVDGKYIKGSPIWNAYDTYKKADKKAGEASTEYKDNARQLKVKKPWRPDERPTQCGGNAYYKEGHAKLEPLAGTAQSTAGQYVSLV